MTVLVTSRHPWHSQHLPVQLVFRVLSRHPGGPAWSGGAAHKAPPQHYVSCAVHHSGNVLYIYTHAGSCRRPDGFFH